MHIIAGLYRHRTLTTPKGLQTKPTTSKMREAVFNICQNYIADARFLDLYAGSGAMGYEALSRGASQATFVDNSREAIRCLKENAAALKVQSQCQILPGHVMAILKGLESQKQQFNIIYADPPYNQTDAELLVRFIDETNLLLPTGAFFIEESLEGAPQLEDLKTLRLVSSRKFGKSVLLEYEKM